MQNRMRRQVPTPHRKMFYGGKGQTAALPFMRPGEPFYRHAKDQCVRLWKKSVFQEDTKKMRKKRGEEGMNRKIEIKNHWNPAIKMKTNLRMFQ